MSRRPVSSHSYRPRLGFHRVGGGLRLRLGLFLFLGLAVFLLGGLFLQRVGHGPVEGVGGDAVHDGGAVGQGDGVGGPGLVSRPEGVGACGRPQCDGGDGGEAQADDEPCPPRLGLGDHVPVQGGDVGEGDAVLARHGHGHVGLHLDAVDVGAVAAQVGEGHLARIAHVEHGVAATDDIRRVVDDNVAAKVSSYGECFHKGVVFNDLRFKDLLFIRFQITNYFILITLNSFFKAIYVNPQTSIFQCPIMLSPLHIIDKESLH